MLYYLQLTYFNFYSLLIEFGCLLQAEHMAHISCSLHITCYSLVPINVLIATASS